MKRYFVSFFLCLFCFSAATADEEKTTALPLSKEKMENKRISLLFTPDAEGRILSLKYGNVEMFSPFKAEKLAGNPLFEPVAANARGWAERFWKKPLSAAPLPVKRFRNNGREAIIEMPYFGNSQLSVVREMKLHPEGGVLEICSRAASAQNNDNAAFSLTVFPVPGAQLFFPAREGNKEKNISPPPGAGTCRYVPGASFAWCRLGDLIMVIESEDADFLMSWRARDTGARIERTMEIIGKKHQLPHSWKNRFLFFTKLKEIRSISGVRGFDIQTVGSKHFLLMEAVAPVGAEKIRIGRYPLMLPAQKANELTRVELPALPEKYFFRVFSDR